MKSTILILILLAAAPASAESIDLISWLEGRWQMDIPGGFIEETWLAPRGNSMIGVSRTVRSDTLYGFETIVVRETAQGLTLEARPSSQPPGTFSSVTVTDSIVVFANPAHDFPQRITYRRVSADSLAAWIEGEYEGEQARVDFGFRRAPESE
jgi:hypothetical protein